MIKRMSPIAVFVYNRPDHTKLTIEALRRNKYARESDLFIFSDGAKITGDPGRDRDTENKVNAVRDYIATIGGFRNVTLNLRESNYGLAKNLIEGITEILSRYSRIIVLEDDIITSPAFLTYMNLALERYELVKKVYTVSGYSYIKGYNRKPDLPETYFLPISCSWSWGTWKDRWEHFDAEASGWERLFKDPRERKRFDFGGFYDYSNMLKAQMQHDIDSWAIRWYWSIYKKEGLTLFPLKSYVRNNGFDGSGVHTIGTPPREIGMVLNEKEDILFPEKIEVNGRIQRMAQRSLDEGMIVRCYRRAKNIISSLLKCADRNR